MAADGRHLRRDQNRAAVLDALSGLFAEGEYSPTSRQIAERAGLSLRSVARYFDDFDDLIRSAIKRIEGQALELARVPMGPELPTADKIDAIVATRVRLFETVTPAARAGRVCAHRQPVVAEELARTRGFLRRQLSELFAPELERTGSDLLAALDILLSFESYDLMRTAQGLSRPATVAALTSGVRMLLHPATVAG